VISPGAVEYSGDFAVDFAGRTSPCVVRTSGGIAGVAELARDPSAKALAERFARHAAELGAQHPQRSDPPVRRPVSPLCGVALHGEVAVGA
jgi:hypothetical protein